MCFKNKFCKTSEGYAPAVQGMKPSLSNKLSLSKAICFHLEQEQWIIKLRKHIPGPKDIHLYLSNASMRFNFLIIYILDRKLLVA